MKIREVITQRFMGFEHTSVELPDNGIVLLVGRNGQGKSMLLEAAAMANWGESLRGCSPWQPGRSGAVQVTSSIGTVKRTATSKHVKTVKWSGCPDDSLTASKSQALLDRVLPPFSTWCKTNTFSADVLDNFSNATDKQRKQLLEDVIRLDKFDVALERAKKALSNAKLAHSQHTQAFSSTQGEIRRLHGMLAELQSLQTNTGTEVDLADLRAQIKVLQEQLVGARKVSAEAQVQMQEWTVRRADKLARQSVARDTLRRLSSGVCPTCGQTATNCLESAQCVVEEIATQLAAIGPAPDLRPADHEVSRLTQEIQALTQRGVSMKEAMTRNADLASKLAGIAAQTAELEAALAPLQENVEKARAEIDLQEVCVMALGLKGIRAHLLGGALAALESGANYWLSRFYPENNVHLKIHLSGESVAFEVDGLAMNVGYKGLSSGQKRRVNLAVVMALGNLAGYAGGQAGGTIFFDEVLDTLDQEGYEVAAEVLRELAQDNCIVVISHSRELVRRLRPDIIYKVEDGKYTRVNSAEESLSQSANPAAS